MDGLYLLRREKEKTEEGGCGTLIISKGYDIINIAEPCLRAGKNELLVRAYHRGEDFAVSRTVPATVAAGGIFSYRGGFWRGGEPGPIGVGVLCIRPLSRQKGEKLK